MKFALVNGVRQEARPDLSGTCPACSRSMVAKCGEIKVWHWAHRGARVCDPWWENETEWHRRWKSLFPTDWQEVVLKAESGEKHVADVKTDHGWVIEFQHSYLNPEERRSRNAFYQKLVWVVDGTRRKTDRMQFTSVLERSAQVGSNSAIRKVPLNQCSMLREWGDANTPVFFDFGPGPTLWWLIATGSSGFAYVAPFSRADFLEIHTHGDSNAARDFHALANDIAKRVENYEAQPAKQPTLQATALSLQYLSRRTGRRRL